MLLRRRDRLHERSPRPNPPCTLARMASPYSSSSLPQYARHGTPLPGRCVVTGPSPAVPSRIRAVQGPSPAPTHILPAMDCRQSGQRPASRRHPRHGDRCDAETGRPSADRRRLMRERWRRGYGERVWPRALGFPQWFRLAVASIRATAARTGYTQPHHVGCLVIDRVGRRRCHRHLANNEQRQQTAADVRTRGADDAVAESRPLVRAVRYGAGQKARVRAGARLESIRQGFTEGRDHWHPCATSPLRQRASQASQQMLRKAACNHKCGGPIATRVRTPKAEA